MMWLLMAFRVVAAWMRARGLVTGRVQDDRRVFLQAFVAMGGEALLSGVRENATFGWGHDGDVYYVDTETVGNVAVPWNGGLPDSFTLEDLRAAVDKLKANNVPAPDGYYRLFCSTRFSPDDLYPPEGEKFKVPL